MIQNLAPREICFNTQQLDVTLMNGSKIYKFASFAQSWDIIYTQGKSAGWTECTPGAVLASAEELTDTQWDANTVAQFPPLSDLM